MDRADAARTPNVPVSSVQDAASAKYADHAAAAMTRRIKAVTALSVKAAANVINAVPDAVAVMTAYVVLIVVRIAYATAMASVKKVAIVDVMEKDVRFAADAIKTDVTAVRAHVPDAPRTTVTVFCAPDAERVVSPIAVKTVHAAHVNPVRVDVSAKNARTVINASYAAIADVPTVMTVNAAMIVPADFVRTRAVKNAQCAVNADAAIKLLAIPSATVLNAETAESAVILPADRHVHAVMLQVVPEINVKIKVAESVTYAATADAAMTIVVPAKNVKVATSAMNAVYAAVAITHLAMVLNVRTAVNVIRLDVANHVHASSAMKTIVPGLYAPVAASA